MRKEFRREDKSRRTRGREGGGEEVKKRGSERGSEEEDGRMRGDADAQGTRGKGTETEK